MFFLQIHWEIINEFGNLTGESIILNMSFNIKGEPMINTPSEASRCSILAAWMPFSWWTTSS